MDRRGFLRAMVAAPVAGVAAVTGTKAATEAAMPMDTPAAVTITPTPAEALELEDIMPEPVCFLRTPDGIPIPIGYDAAWDESGRFEMRVP